MLDFLSLKKNPKWLVGYSDFTVFHLAMYRLGVQTFHATMPISFDDAQGVESLRVALFGENLNQKFTAHELNVKGVAQGRLIGGNLSIIYSLQGTPYALLPDNAILFIEDLDEYLYHVDRMMMSLELSGQLSKIKGLLVGGMSDMKDNAIPFGKNAFEIIREHAEKFGIPVAFDFPAGHRKPNVALRFGATVELKVGAEFSELAYL
jgi:muramoyltetrapeptide carboxypeptidase